MAKGLCHFDCLVQSEKNLACEFQSIIGYTWKPGQVSCNVHFTLAIAEGIKSVVGSYQNQIGAEKLLPQAVKFEMNIEDKLVNSSGARLLG